MMDLNKLNPTQLSAKVSAIVAAVKAKQDDGTNARNDNETALSRVRELAATTAEAGADAKMVADLIAAALVANGIKAGTARPYAMAYKGFRVAISEGKSVTEYAKKANGKYRPMSASEAQQAAKWADMTPAEREQAKAEGELQAIRDEIAKRLNGITDAATLNAIRDQLPEVAEDDSVKTETAAEKAQREAAERVKALLAEVAEAEPAQPAQVAEAGR